MSNIDDEWDKFLKGDDFACVPVAASGGGEVECGELYISTQSKIVYLNQTIDINGLFWAMETLQYHVLREGVVKKQIKISCVTQEEIDDVYRRAGEIDQCKVDVLKRDMETRKEEVKYVGFGHKRRVVRPLVSKKKYLASMKVSVGLCQKDLINNRVKDKRAFYNCIVIIFRIKFGDTFREMHIKVFNTGKVEIPGIQADETLPIVLDKLVGLIESYRTHAGITDKLAWQENTIQTILINSNFNCGYFINREALYSILRSQHNIECYYDPTSYPGIQCKYYFNKCNDRNDGICQCTADMKSNYAKELLHGDEMPADYHPRKSTEGDFVCIKRKTTCQCVVVSFMVFRTGNVLIVGHCNYDKLRRVYEFIRTVLENNYATINQPNGEKIEKPPANEKTYKRVITVERMERIVIYKRVQ